MLSRRALLSVVFVVSASCVPKHLPTGTSLVVGGVRSEDDGPFRVLFASPSGEVAKASEVAIAFSRSVHAPALGAGIPAPAAVTRAHDGSPVEGTWHWFGDDTAVFQPKTRFADATSYAVAVDRGLRAIDGTTLGPTSPMGFVTARPALASVKYEYQRPVDRHLLHLEFNQRIDPAEAQRAIRLEGRGPAGAQRVGYDVVERTPSSQLTLRADAAIARLEHVTVTTAASLAGVGGPLVSEREHAIEVEGVGPLRVALWCKEPGKAEAAPIESSSHCALEGSTVELRLSKASTAREIQRHLVVSSPRKVQKWIDAWNRMELTRVDLGSAMELASGQKFSVKVTAGLVANDGDRLATDRAVDFETSDAPPSLVWRDFTGAESVVESARPRVPLHVRTTNVSWFGVARAPLDEARLLELLFAPRADADRLGHDAEWVRALSGGPDGGQRIAVRDPSQNAGRETEVDLRPSIGGVGTSGTFAVATSGPGLRDEVRILSVTDLGITSKWSPHGGLVWVTHLSSAAPVEGATVSVRRVWHSSGVQSAEAFATTTDKDGFATIPAQVAATFLREPAPASRTQPDAVLFVGKESDHTYARLPELNPELVTEIGKVFAERAIYRPGETVYVKGFFRAPTRAGLVTLAGKVVQAEALDSDKRVFQAGSVRLDAFGAFAWEVPIPRTTRLGYAHVRARVNLPVARPDGHSPDDSWSASTGFDIDEFRTPELKVEAHLDRESYARNDKASLTVAGTYLLGTPMQSAPVTVRVSRRETTFTPRTLAGFSTDARFIDASESDGLSELAGTLGADGKGTIAIPLPTSKRTTPDFVKVEVSVDDASRAFAMGASDSALVHPGDFYVGIRTPRDEPIVPNRPVHAEVAAAMIDGARKAGVAVHIELLRQPKKGTAASTGRSCDVTTTAATASCDLVVTDEGLHWLRATAVDSQGRSIIAATSFEVEKKGARSAPPPVARKPRPEAPPLSFEDACRRPAPADAYDPLALEHDESNVGAAVLACLRGKGRGLLSLEREGVLRQYLHPLAPIGRVVGLPLTTDLYPSATVALDEVVPRTAPFPGPAKPDVGYPTATTTSKTLVVHDPHKALTVEIETAKEYAPGAEVEARVRVRDDKGAPAPSQVTIWAVDEGIILLRPFRVPNPLYTFEEQRGSDVVELDTRSHVFWERVGFHQTKAPSLRMGSTSVGPEDHVGRFQFRPTAWFLPNVVTGPDGVATVKAKLPDNLTTWKVFAVAATTGDAFGSTEGSFRTNKGLMIRPALPRFLRTGDRIDATTVIDSLSNEPLDVKVTMSTSGTLAGKGTRSLTVPPLGHVPVRFPMEAKAVGSGKITFRAEAEKKGLFDEVVLDEEVKPVLALETVVLAGETKTRADEGLGDLSRVRADVGGLDYRFSTTPLVGLAESLRDLVEYPYGCTEQLTSRLLPLLRLRTMAQDFGVTLPSDVDASVRASLATLLSHQHSDGGFGFWLGSRSSEAWLTILALSTLHEASERGYVVPRSSIDRAMKYVEDAEAKRAKLDLGSRAMLEDLLASMGRPRAAELGTLAADKDLPLFGQALVAHALAKVDRELARRTLDAITKRARMSAAAVTFADEDTLAARSSLSSNARTTAMVLRALVAIDHESPLIPRVVRGLLSMRHDGRWPTTQASAWALAALDDARPLFAPLPGAPSSAYLAFDGHTVGTTTFAGLPAGETSGGNLSMGRLLAAPGALLSFGTSGRPLFFEGVLRYARREPPSSSLDRGIHVARTMRRIGRNGELSEAPAFEVGEHVVVDVLISSTTARDLVVLDDPIPSGFDAINQNFAHADKVPETSDPAQHIVTHRELHDDRVLSFFDQLPAGVHLTRYALRVTSPGRFVVPPAKVECMYAPDVFGRTGTTWVEAIAR